jgi:hypothetical protein
VRLRRTEDLPFLRPGLLDELIVNANQLENSPQSTSAHLRQTGLPYMVDPMLWRLQVPAWWRNAKGDVKRNYRRLAKQYSHGTSIRMAEGPLLETVPSDTEWKQLAANVVKYHRERLDAIPSQLDLLDGDGRLATELRPLRVIAPTLVALGRAEDRINGLLIEAAVAAAAESVVAIVAVPARRLRQPDEVTHLLSHLPSEAVSAYFLWTPDVTEQLLLMDDSLFAEVLLLVSRLRKRGIPLVHLQGSYVTEALHVVGVDGVAHHLGWADRGEPAAEQRGGLRSSVTYVPGLRHCVRFNQARRLGQHLNEAEYLERFCNCTFCVGLFGEVQHPFDVLLEEHLVDVGGGRQQWTPTSRAATANTWHYLLARRQEIHAFSTEPALEVIERDFTRAVALAGEGDAGHLQRLAAQLSTG